MKRICDFSLALLGMVFSFPIWVILGFLIFLEDGGPIFYVQDRLGKNGILFWGLKFRSMRTGAERRRGPVQAREHDRRTTRLGKLMRKTALDELPQLWNILKGEMSFVGPRAIRPIEADTHDDRLRGAWEFSGFKERSTVCPGLTGVAQILVSRTLPRSEKFKYDVWYVKNKSFWLDLRIVLLSFLITFSGKWEVKGVKTKGFAQRLHAQILRDIS